MQIKVAHEGIRTGAHDQEVWMGWTLENGDELASWFHVGPAEMLGRILYISLPDAKRAGTLAGERPGIQRRYCQALMRKAMRLYRMVPEGFSLEYVLFTDEAGRLFYAPLHFMEPGQKMPDKEGLLRVPVGREPVALAWYDPGEGIRLKKGLPE